MIDIYGKPVTFTIGRDKNVVTTVFGGLMTILFVCCVTMYLSAEVINMFSIITRFYTSDFTYKDHG